MLLLASCCKNSEVVSKNVVVIESIHIARQPLPAYPDRTRSLPENETLFFAFVLERCVLRVLGTYLTRIDVKFQIPPPPARTNVLAVLEMPA